MEDIFEELAAVISDDEGRAEENDQGGGGNRDDEAEEANDTRRVVKPKRVISRPQPKLNPARLLGPRGMFTIRSTFDNIKFRGKGHELDDLNNVLSRLQHWAHRLFPKMTFEDCIDRIETLGNKREIMTNMHKIRNGMIDPDDGQTNQDNDEVDIDVVRVVTPPPVDNAFDQLIARGAAPVAPPITLTDEQRARMMRNRLIAEERRLARRLAREKELEDQRLPANRGADESTVPSTSNDEVELSSTSSPKEAFAVAASTADEDTGVTRDTPSKAKPGSAFDDPAPTSLEASNSSAIDINKSISPKEVEGRISLNEFSATQNDTS